MGPRENRFWSVLEAVSRASEAGLLSAPPKTWNGGSISGEVLRSLTLQPMLVVVPSCFRSAA